MDKWGGSLEKHMAFPLAVVREVKRIVTEYAPKDFIIGYRISPEEIHGSDIGYTYRESTQLIAEVIKEELDYIVKNIILHKRIVLVELGENLVLFLYNEIDILYFTCVYYMLLLRLHLSIR